MADIGVDRLGFVCEERIGGVYERATGIDNVVHEHASIAGNITDYVHHLGLARAFAALVDDGERRIDPFRQAARTHYAADVGRHYHRSEEHTSELQSLTNLVCRLLLE